MNDSEKILQRICLCASRHAPSLASQLLRHLQLDKNAISIAQVSHPVWQNIAEFVKAILKTDISAEQRLYLQKLLDTASIRRFQEDQISHLVIPRDLRLAAMFSNYNAFRYAALIKKLLRHSSYNVQAFPTAKFSISKLEEFADNISTLFDAMRFLHRKREQRFYDTGKKAHLKTMQFYETLYASMINNLQKPTRQEIFCGFQTCDLCWRLVPPSNFAICRCERHSPENPGVIYTRALKIGNFWGKRRAPEALTYLQQKISGKLSPLFKTAASTDAYYDPVLDDIGSEEAHQHFESITPVPYNLAQIWKVLSRTRRYIESRNGNIYDMKSILSILNPSPPNEPKEFCRHRQWLHQALCRDPSPFKSELAKCEAWLRLHATMFGHLRHGGPRCNAGGKRPGAGRPPKVK